MLDDTVKPYLPGQRVCNFGVPGNGFHVTSLRILPQSVFFALAVQHTPLRRRCRRSPSRLIRQSRVSCLASGGRARRDSSRRCSKISAIASRKFAWHSACVFPCPFAPGTSAQYATNHGPSRSTSAVNSFRMALLYRKAGNQSPYVINSSLALLDLTYHQATEVPRRLCLSSSAKSDRSLFRRSGQVGH
jgi:hypothetical protein